MTLRNSATRPAYRARRHSERAMHLIVIGPRPWPGPYTTPMKPIVIALVLVAACKADPPNEPVDAPSGPGTPDGPTADGWTPLIARSWKLIPGATNTYKCTRIEVANDLWISGF